MTAETTQKLVPAPSGGKGRGLAAYHPDQIEAGRAAYEYHALRVRELDFGAKPWVHLSADSQAAWIESEMRRAAAAARAARLANTSPSPDEIRHALIELGEEDLADEYAVEEMARIAPMLKRQERLQLWLTFREHHRALVEAQEEADRARHDGSAQAARQAELGVQDALGWIDDAIRIALRSIR